MELRAWVGLSQREAWRGRPAASGSETAVETQRIDNFARVAEW